jgi:lipid II:glycine glycyltransferase (peptidoglycan interpeptide bridge formation enzyme)
MSTYIATSVDEASYATVLERLEAHIEPSVSFLQSPAYAKLQTAAGKEAVFIQITKDDELVGCGVGVRYSAPGSLAYLYFPYGPIVTDYSPKLFKAITEALRPIAKSLGCTFVRIDNTILANETAIAPVSNALARTSSLQPRIEWVLSLHEPLENIWMKMHKHARYNVRLADRANATFAIYPPNKAPLDTFYELMQTTAKRDDFSIFDKSYYQAAFENITADEGFVAICTIGGAPAAAALFIVHDKQAHYVFAGSSNDFRKIAPAYFLIWKSMTHAKESFGCNLFNFGGVQDSVKKLHLAGVTGFKKRFGGYEVPHLNPVDIVYSPLKYALFSLYKQLHS